MGMPFLIELALEMGWAWPLKLYSLSVNPWTGVYITEKGKREPKNCKPWILETEDQVKQVANIFGMTEETIPWDNLVMGTGEALLEEGNPVLFFETTWVEPKYGKKKLERSIEFHKYVWDAGYYRCIILAKL